MDKCILQTCILGERGAVIPPVPLLPKKRLEQTFKIRRLHIKFRFHAGTIGHPHAQK